MLAFYRLLLAHLLADFPLQSKAIYELKLKSKLGLLIHSMIFLTLAMLLSLPYLNHLHAWVLLLLLGFTHFVVDSLKKFLFLRGVDNLFIFLLDQLLHVGFIFLFVSNMSAESLELPLPIQQIYSNRTLILYACGYIITSFGGVILIPYIIKLKDYKYERYFGIGERVIVTTLILLPPPFYLLIFPLIILRALIHPGKLLPLILSTGLASIVGVWLRLFV